MDIYIFFMCFLAVATTVSWQWGEMTGRRLGQKDMVLDMLERKIVTTEQLEKHYID
tara:strand:+ start:57 stop:224 length:168 start_codon:yes stop_codon:yes gene_type:complete